jgi:hypothetical protein
MVISPTYKYDRMQKTLISLPIVVSCRLMQKESRELYYIGIEFLDMSEKDGGILTEIIDSIENMIERSSSIQT